MNYTLGEVQRIIDPRGQQTLLCLICYRYCFGQQADQMEKVAIGRHDSLEYPKATLYEANLPQHACNVKNNSSNWMSWLFTDANESGVNMDDPIRALWTADTASLEAPELRTVARLMIAARRSLHGPLPSELLHDPALEILLQLFLVAEGGERIEAKRICREIARSSSTLERWGAALKQYGLVDRNDEGYMLTPLGQAKTIEAIRAVVASQNKASLEVDSVR